jgi:hypothetical protein
MNTLSPILNLRFVGIALAVLAAMALCPSRSQAACGDYVHIEKANAGDTGKAPTPKPPCDGPNCSNRQAPPAAPMSIPVTETEVSKPLAKLMEAFDPSDAIRIRLLTRTSFTLPEPAPTSIFHPPRSV